MKLYTLTKSLAVAVLVFAGASIAMPALAQYSAPTYTTWQSQWDYYHYDRHHVMLGTVVAFSPYRLTIHRHNGITQLVYLKNGTIIYPTGATPAPGQRVAVVGDYSNGGFVVNKVILHP